MGRLWLMVLAAAALIWGGVALAAERKVALVIGNSAYTGISRLSNPSNDAKLITASAKEAGFEVVLANDLSIADFQKTLREFRLRAQGADVVMVYYAGHGMEGQGQNWLIPVDAQLETEYDLPYEAISIERLLEAVSGARVRVLVLDACRNNPFGNRWKRGVRAVPSGLAGMEIDDVLVIYAAAPGQVALDGKAGNSPFAASLAKRMVEPGLPLQLLAGAVRDDVLAATGGNQRPFVSASITGTPVYLMPQAAAPTAPAAPDRASLDALMWQGALSANSVPGYEAYLKEFPKGLFAGLATANLDKLRGSAPAAQTPQLAASEPAADSKKKKRKGEDKPAASSPAAELAAAPSLAAAPPGPVPAPQLAASTPSAAQPKPSVNVPGNADLARANAALVDKAPLPVIPAAPVFSAAGYPACRDEFQKKGSSNDKVEAINRCTVALDQYYRTTLNPFHTLMGAHQDMLSRLYSEKVGGHPEYTPESQQRFFAEVNQAHAQANPDGKDFAEHRATEERYKADRAFLADRYCFFTGSCNGYKKPKD